MTKEEKIRRFEEMNKEVVPGQIVCARTKRLLMQTLLLKNLPKNIMQNTSISMIR